MIANRILTELITEASSNFNMEMQLKDAFGRVIADTFEEPKSEGSHIFEIEDDGSLVYELYVKESPQAEIIAGMTVLSIKSLIRSDKDVMDKKEFFQKLLLGELSDESINSMTRRFHINNEKPRCVYIIDPEGKDNGNIIKIIKELFSIQAGDIVIESDKGRIILIRSLDDISEAEETAKMIVDTVSAEAMQTVKVAYGNTVTGTDKLPRAYREAKMALEVGEIFYVEKNIIAYAALGVGRLIYQLPVDLCKIYVKEIFGENVPEELDEEIILTINRFFENNLNVSETSRQLSMHRNTLLYRIDKVQKATGLDVRIFDDALSLKIALMVVNYIKYIEEGSGRKEI